MFFIVKICLLVDTYFASNIFKGIFVLTNLTFYLSVINTMDQVERNDSNRRVEITKFLAHLIVISMLFLLPEFIMSYTMPNRRGGGTMQWIMYVKSVICIIVFYINYYFIIEKTLTPKVQVWKFLGYNLLVLICALGFGYILWYYFAYLPRIDESATHPLRNPDKYRLMFVSSMLRDGVLIIMTMALAVALRLSDKWSALERHRRDMADEQRSTELRNLKNQINPHFLFNTLNSIYALIEINQAEAQQAVHELSQMLRYMLYETPTTVTVKQETDFTHNYISLMELRLPAGLVEVNYDIESMSQAPIAPLLFISLIENAFKHGNTGNANDRISININAHDGKVTCRTDNRFDSRTMVDRQGGIGIANLRRRLLLIYGDKASLTTTIEGDRYTACLEITIVNQNKA